MQQPIRRVAASPEAPPAVRLAADGSSLGGNANHPPHPDMRHSHATPDRVRPSSFPPLVALDEDFCLPVASPVRRPLSLLEMPAPSRVDDLDLDDPFGERPSRLRTPDRPRKFRPTFVPLRPETFVAAKDPWAVNSLLDLLRFFLPEVSVSTALAALSGLLAGKLLARWAGGIEPMWVLGCYLAVFLLQLGSLYLGGKGANSSRLKSSLRQMVLAMFLLFLPHAVAFALLSASP